MSSKNGKGKEFTVEITIRKPKAFILTLQDLFSGLSYTLPEHKVKRHIA